MAGRSRWQVIVSYSVLGFLLLLTLIPYMVMIVRSFKSLNQTGISQIFPTLPLHYGNYIQAWKMIAQFMINSVLVVVLTLAGVLLLSTVTAYVFARYDFPGREPLFWLVLALLMIPGIISLIPLFVLVASDLKLKDNYLGLLLPYWSGGQVFAIFVLRTFFASLPEELYESARLDGAGHLRLYWNLTLPLSGPILSVIAILNILGTWNDYLWPLLILTNVKMRTVTIGLTFLRDTMFPRPGVEMAAYVIASIPMFILFLATMRTFIRGITAGALKL
ncbi:MAG: carbohydrate ABC transporter permease [Chloroflexi bacterium]|nr:carbohydrate ABC transporter permease [Chloroflexota bacterium]